MADLGVAGILVALEELPRGQNHAGRAETALQAVGLAEGFLQRMQPALGRQALDGGDLGAVGLNGEQGVQDLTAWPSTTTVQAPQLLVSQPTWVPVRLSTSRK